MKKKVKTCTDCRKRRLCIDRSRDYPCIEFKPLNQSKKEKATRQY